MPNEKVLETMVFRRRGAKGPDIRETVPTLGGPRARLSAAFTEELHSSVRKLEYNVHQKPLGEITGESHSGGGKRQEGSTRTEPKMDPSVIPTSPIHHNEAQGMLLEASPGVLINPHHNSSLREENDENLKSSSHHSDSRSFSRRQQVRARLTERKNSKKQEQTYSPRSNAGDDELSISEPLAASQHGPPTRTQHETDDDFEGQKVPPGLFEELRRSLQDKDNKAIERRERIKERIMTRRQSQKNLGDSAKSFVSFADSEASKRGTPSEHSGPSPQRRTIQKPYWNLGHDSESSSTGSRSDSRVDDEEFKFPGGSKSEKAEWARLLRAKDKSDKQVSALFLEVNDLRSESKALRKELTTWNNKVTTLSNRQSDERKKFQNSADMVAKARVELTKSLNEQFTLKGKLHELLLSADIRDRGISALNETVDLQAKKITSMTRNLRDAEIELEHYATEKRRLEEEVAVLTFSRDGNGIGQVLQQLEQSRGGWMEERERALETKRLALDAENSRILERDKNQHRREAEQLMEVAKATRERERELDRVHADINKQVEALKEANDELKALLKDVELESHKEIQRKEHTIKVIEQEVSKLRRKLAASQLREQENQALLAEIENNSEELRKALERNRLLEKKVRKLKDLNKGKKNRSEGADWKEIVLPGYKHLRGVTFGAPSEELAGFLTILVEDQAAKKAESMTEVQKEVRRYLQESRDQGDDIDRGKRPKKDKKTGSKSKAGMKRGDGISKKKSSDMDTSSRLPKTKPSKKTKSWKQLARELERELEILEEESYRRSPHRKKAGRKIKYKKRHTRDDDETTATFHRVDDETTATFHRDDDETTATFHRRRKRKRLKSRSTGNDRIRSKRRYQDSDDSSSGYRRKKKTSRDRKPHRSRSKRGADKRRSSRARHSPRYPTLDDNLEMVDALEDTSSRLSNIPDPDDISLVVMKQSHVRKTKGKHKHQGATNGRNRGISPSAPPQMIALQ